MKQFFNRKIDETTRDKIMAEKKAESNTLEVRLKELEKERDMPMRAKASPLTILSWMGGGPKRLAGRFRRKKAVKEVRSGKMSRKMADVQRKLIERQKR